MAEKYAPLNEDYVACPSGHALNESRVRLYMLIMTARCDSCMKALILHKRFVCNVCGYHLCAKCHHERAEHHASKLQARQRAYESQRFDIAVHDLQGSNLGTVLGVHPTWTGGRLAEEVRKTIPVADGMKLTVVCADGILDDVSSVSAMGDGCHEVQAVISVDHAFHIVGRYFCSNLQRDAVNGIAGSASALLICRDGRAVYCKTDALSDDCDLSADRQRRWDGIERSRRQGTWKYSDEDGQLSLCMHTTEESMWLHRNEDGSLSVLGGSIHVPTERDRRRISHMSPEADPHCIEGALYKKLNEDQNARAKKQSWKTSRGDIQDVRIRHVMECQKRAIAKGDFCLDANDETDLMFDSIIWPCLGQ